MGGIARLLSFVRRQRNGASVSDVVSDPGGGPNLTAEHFAAPGDDSHPLPDDFVLLVPVQGRGRVAAAGYLDPNSSQTAQAGERRLYARDNNGAAVATVWIKNTGEVLVTNDNGSVKLRPDGGTVTTSPLATFDVAASGSVRGENAAGFFELQSGGTVNINGVTISPAGVMTTPSGAGRIVTPSAIINGVEAAGHIHDQDNDSDGDSEQPTDPMREP